MNSFWIGKCFMRFLFRYTSESLDVLQNHTTLDDFDEEYYTDYINWVESDNSPFMDKTGCASWLKINTSFQGILNCSALEVKQRLIELLNISKFDE